MVTYYVEVLLNRTEDEDGHLAIFSRFHDEDTYQSDDVLEQVWSGNITVNEAAESVLDKAFEMFNRGAPLFIGDHEYPQRSLSIGDVIRLDECDRWVVESTGWQKLPYS
jgi:hypothetical protein